MSQTLIEQGFQRGRSGNAGGLATNGTRFRTIFAELEADITSDGAGALKPSEAVLLQQVALSFSRSERSTRDVANATKSANAGARILRELRAIRRERAKPKPLASGSAALGAIFEERRQLRERGASK